MKEALFNEFESLSPTEWKEQIIKDLKGADYTKKVVWHTSEGFKLEPFYTKHDLENLNVIKEYSNQYKGNKLESNQWKIRQDIVVNDVKNANKKALDVLMKGANSLNFIFPSEDVLSQSEFSELLNKIKLDAIELNFNGLHPTDYVSMLLNELNNQKIDSNTIKGSISFNPLGFILQNGVCIERSPEIAFIKLAKMFDFVMERLPNMQFININGDLFHNSGSNLSQELGFSLAMASDYINILSKQGIKKSKIAKHIRFTFSVGSNYFLEIAKFRAARWLWAKILEEWDINANDMPPMIIHAETSHWNMTVYDSYVNMLRSTTEAMSAVIAGVDSLTVLPFDNPYASANDFSERIARNLQSILKEEAYLDKVIDPSAGSYYIEELTSKLGEQAWNYFVDIENDGGFYNDINSGYIQNSIIEVARNRDMAVALGKIVLLGTNKFPNSNETSIKQKSDKANYKSDIKATNQIIHPLEPYRGASAFEELRQATEAFKVRPKVFLFNYGNPNMRKARASFAQNFFACAGFEIIDNSSGFDTIKEANEAYLKSKAHIVVACSSDEEYENFVYQLNDNLIDKAILVIAGNPVNRTKFHSAGIKNFIHINTNVLEKLQVYQEQVKKIIAQ